MQNRLAPRSALWSLWVDSCPSGCSLLLLVVMLLVGTACVEKKMTVEDARQVTVDMAAKSFEMPPRRVSDILELLDRETLQDESSGQTIAAYAHPFFWAPFIVVGDGG